ncbi:hypothetical protein GCM10010109_35930 [Actinoplanes campanulatus]|nr:hypothetical protein GCM10010109_35930 [Actinoplanes campanulatus]GID35557.1 hypothetical protein Aca09nite_20630 [Actinoplanes campanulatus]
MTVGTPRRVLWHPLVAAALIGAAATGGVLLHIGAVSVAALIGWLVAGAAGGFAVSGST